MKGFFLRYIFVVLVFVCSWTVGATEYLQVQRGVQVEVFKDPVGSRIIVKLEPGNEVEIISSSAEWYKVKIPYQSGYLMGWVKKDPRVRLVNRDPSYVPVEVNKNIKLESEKKTLPAPEPIERSTVAPQPQSTPPPIHMIEETEDYERGDGPMIKGFVGPVFNVYRYEAFQYRFGLSYEMPVSETLRLGIPVSYTTGDIFNILQGGVDLSHLFFSGSLGMGPKIGVGYEYLFGNDRSFHAIIGELGFIVEYALSENFVLGALPFGGRFMAWNTTKSINEVPYNVRGESLIMLRGRW